ncbi:HAD-IIA family hydrolase [Nocardioides sp. Kera G14]|uniref:HAD-IIA family hydrolase n=1 Tax=Nocardioides sp. Kera G14 TaxID=2884264 RepID=UPI001D11DCD8|nr:HAD-IIA family hydrolase [Nocardioides sp. Kera G14]UDY25275.1 HAD-IIA family hydrolase [Nocardioides sp. Kera G14]
MKATGARPLTELYDLVMLDLDGVVYISGAAVPGAPDHLAAARAAETKLAFITNNAARTPDAVADHLRELGITAEAGDVVTSAQAAARVLVERLGTGTPVAALGAEGLFEALRAEGLVAVPVDDDSAQALVDGYGPDVLWKDVMRAAVRIREGLWWVATNTDMSIPTAYGTAPGNGVIVDMLRRFSGVEPEVAGKPDRPLLDETIRRVGGERPLMVGDRLDTDILGGHNAGVDTLLVMTGVTGLEELVAAVPGERPTYISSDLAGLLEPHPVVHLDGESVTSGGWRARIAPDGTVAVDGAGDSSDWWRVVAAVAWDRLDRTGTPVDVSGLRAPGR